ncbi:hypothetical protein D3C84_874460 [compost metagenome]
MKRMVNDPLQRTFRPFEIFQRLGGFDLVVRHPQRTDDPRVPRHFLDIARLLEVIIVRIPGDAAYLRPNA